MDTTSIMTFLRVTAAERALKIFAALAFWIVGRWLIGRVIALMSAAMNWNHVHPTLTKPEVSLRDLNLVGPVIAVRPYCHSDRHWQVYFDTNAAIVRVAAEAKWPASTPTTITKMIQMPA